MYTITGLKKKRFHRAKRIFTGRYHAGNTKQLIQDLKEEMSIRYNVDKKQVTIAPVRGVYMIYVKGNKVTEYYHIPLMEKSSIGKIEFQTENFYFTKDGSDQPSMAHNPMMKNLRSYGFEISTFSGDTLQYHIIEDKK